MSRKTPRKLPLDLPMPQVRHREHEYRRAGRQIEEINKTPSFLRRLIISAVIVGLVFILKNIDTDFTQTIVGYIKDGITEDIDFHEYLGKLKFVNEGFSDSLNVFGTQEGYDKEKSSLSSNKYSSLGIPAEGKVVKGFNGDNEGIEILGKENNKVYAAGDGLVIAVGEEGEENWYIKINHGNNLTTLYGGCSQIKANIGENVAKGEEIGIMGEQGSEGHLLRFQVLAENKPVDPLKLIGENK